MGLLRRGGALSGKEDADFTIGKVESSSETRIVEELSGYPRFDDEDVNPDAMIRRGRGKPAHSFYRLIERERDHIAI